MPGRASEIDLKIDCPTSLNARVAASSAPDAPAPLRRHNMWAAPAVPPDILPDTVP